MKLTSVLMCAAALLARTAPALACGAQDEPYYEPSEQGPNGGSVPLNAPLVIVLSESTGGPAEPHLNPIMSLRVHGTDEAVQLKATGSAPRLAWVPEQPLAPVTTYEAHFSTGYEGAPKSTWLFTTGEESAAPLSLEGPLVATLEQGREPAIVCPPGNCGCSQGDCMAACRNGSPEPVTQVRVKLPRVSGGFAPRVGTLWLTDERPYDFTEPTHGAPSANGGHVVSLADVVTFDHDGRPTKDVVMTLPEEAEPYRPCFALRVTDERGDSAFADSFCLNQTFPLASPEVDSSEDEAVVDRSSDTSSACSMGGASPGGATLGTALALAVAALVRRRRFHGALGQ